MIERPVRVGAVDPGMDLETSRIITIAVALISGAGGSYVSTRIAIAVALNDIGWLKTAVEKAHQRIDKIMASIKLE